MLPQSIKKSMLEYSQYKQESLGQQLLALDISAEYTHQFNEQFLQAINCAFFDLVQNGTIYDICSLFDLVVLTTRNKCFNNNTLLNTLDNILQCLCMEDLKRFIVFFIDTFYDLPAIEGYEIHKMLKALNFALKRIPYEDSIIRGQLHCLIIKVLKFGHQSGLQLKKPQKKIVQKCVTQEQFEMCYKNNEFSYQFYHNYWSLNKYLAAQEQDKIIQNALKLSANESRSNIITLLYFHVYNIYMHITKILEYFRQKEISPDHNYTIEQFNIDLTPIPQFLIKYAKKQSFRVILLIRVLIYYEGLKSKLNIFQLSNNDVCKIVKDTEDIVKRYLYTKIKISKSCRLMKMLDCYFSNESRWIQLKSNIKQYRKNSPLYKIKRIKDTSISSQDSYEQPNLQDLLFNSIPQKCFNVKYQQRKFKQEITKKLMITSENMGHFLSTNITPQLKKYPTQTSFSYYFEQGMKCMQSYDEKNERQTYFEDSYEYNLFQWKAMRSLSRENISQFFSHPIKYQQLKDYKILHFLKKNVSQFGYLPKKTAKMIESQTDSD